MAETPKTQQVGGWQSAIDWQSFFTAANYPVFAYDPINDRVVIKQSSDYSASDNQDVLTFDLKTGAWTKSVAAITNTVDTSNFVINGDSELVLKQGAASADFHFKKWSSTPVAKSAIQWTSKAYDFGQPSLKKKLYKVIIHSKYATNVDVNIYYDNSSSAAQSFDKPLETGASYAKDTMTVTTPTAFSYLTIELKSDGASNASFTVNDIALVYRTLRPH